MRRLHLALTCVLLALGATTGATAQIDAGPVPNVRPLHNAARQLLDRGADRSPTFRDLLDRLEGSDVIVYVDVRPDLPQGLGGAMRFIGATTTHRMLRVTINGTHNWGTMVALLGHELQHCVEMVEAPHVRSEDAMRAFYERTGLRLTHNRYDSEAAQTAGRAVRFELTTGRQNLRLARAARDVEDALLSGGSIGSDLMP